MSFQDWFRNFPVFPDQASTVALRVDALYAFLIGITVVFSIAIALMIIIFSVRYRHSRHPVAEQIEGSHLLEIIWSVGPLLISLVIFVWAAAIYFDLQRSPRQAMEVYVTGKQWMWKMQHPSGQREINQLHVPVNRAVRLTMISQDVIHSFFVPAFRIKQDAIPGRYTYTWFEATKPGTYHLFCAEYCGTKHSGMIGQVIVMEPHQYEMWLSGGNSEGSMLSNGEKQFTSLGCISCHSGQSGARGPNLAGLFGKEQKLADGRTVAVDDNYVRESILNPQAKVAAGFQPIMPTFAGQVSEETLMQLLAYVKSMPETPTAGGKAVANTSQAPAEGKKETGKQR